MEFKCEGCEAEFDIFHANDDSPSYCPFCGDDAIVKVDDESEEEPWFDDAEEGDYD